MLTPDFVPATNIICQEQLFHYWESLWFTYWAGGFERWLGKAQRRFDPSVLFFGSCE